MSHRCTRYGSTHAELSAVASERQRTFNNVKDNDITGFGQITALFVSFTPVWSLGQALSEYVQRRRGQGPQIQRNCGVTGQHPGGSDDVQVVSSPRRQRPQRRRNSYEMQNRASESRRLLNDTSTYDHEETSDRSVMNTSVSDD